MKTQKLFFLLATLLAVTVSSHGQAVNITYGAPPKWAPAAPVEAKYYYMPDIETYYDVPAKKYIYLNEGRWYRSTALPVQYRTYNLYKGKTVYITDYKGNRPYVYYKVHKVKYKGTGNWKGKGNFKPNPGKGNDKPKGHPGKGHAKGHAKGHGNNK